MQNKFPDAEIVQDVGSGLNFKRKGIETILERILLGHKLTIIISHRDRLCRFGFDVFKFLIEKNGGKILVLDKLESSPEQELTTDLLSILHIFSCRMHGLRRYTKQIKNDPNLSNE
jgi:predicted site-specific integrase-resolvase